MALDLTPPAWIASWSEDGTNITIPLASLPETDAAEADATTGDFRKVMLAIMECVYQAYLALPTADRPTKMVVNRSSSVNDTTDVITRTYAVAFSAEAAVGGIEVIDEPA
jgi:hypothetical protein